MILFFNINAMEDAGLEPPVAAPAAAEAQAAPGERPAEAAPRRVWNARARLLEIIADGDSATQKRVIALQPEANRMAILEQAAELVRDDEAKMQTLRETIRVVAEEIAARQAAEEAHPAAAGAPDDAPRDGDADAELGARDDAAESSSSDSGADNAEELQQASATAAAKQPAPQQGGRGRRGRR